jgi:hypothetical protein
MAARKRGTPGQTDREKAAAKTARNKARRARVNANTKTEAAIWAGTGKGSQEKLTKARKLRAEADKLEKAAKRASTYGKKSRPTGGQMARGRK